MLRLYILAALKVGYCAGNSQYSVISAGGHSHGIKCLFEDHISCRVKGAMLSYVSGLHLGVTGEVAARKSLLGNSSRLYSSRSYVSRIEKAASEAVAKMAARGVKKTVRVMIVGFNNDAFTLVRTMSSFVKEATVSVAAGQTCPLSLSPAWTAGNPTPRCGF